MKNYNELVLNQNKRELILKKLIKHSLGKYSDGYKIDLQGTTLKVLYKQEIKSTFISVARSEWETMVICEIIDNTFVLRYVHNENVCTWSCPLIDLGDYIFYGFLDKFELMNLIRLCYTSLITKYTWIYDYMIADSNNYRNFVYWCDSNYLYKGSRYDRGDSLIVVKSSKFVAKYNEEVTLSYYGINHNYYCDFQYGETKDIKGTSESLYYQGRDIFNKDRIDYYKTLRICTSIYDYIKLQHVFTKEFVDTFGIETCLSQDWKLRALYDQYTSKLFNLQEVKCLYDNKFDFEKAKNNLKDINKMIDSMFENQKYINPRINNWRLYYEITDLKQLSFKDLININKSHNLLVDYYNQFNKDLRQIKSDFANKETNEAFKLKYKDSTIRRFVDFLKQNKYNAYLLDTANLFVEEGSKQQHCVASYLKGVLNHSSDNYGIIHFEGYTVEVLLDRLGLDENIKQCKGIRNSTNNEIQAKFYGLIVEFSVLNTNKNIRQK